MSSALFGHPEGEGRFPSPQTPVGLAGGRSPRPQTPRPGVALITDRAVCGGTERLEWAVEAAVAGGVDLVQLREKDLDPSSLATLTERLRLLTQGKALLLVNVTTAAHLDAVLACGVDGVHLGEASLPVSSTKRLLDSQGLLVGRSVHGLAAAEVAAREGADLLQAGPVFATASHPGRPAAGVQLIQSVAFHVATPVLGVGGITADNAEQVVAAGASGVAVIREVLCATSPYQAARRLRSAVDPAFEAQRTGEGKLESTA